MKSNNDIDSEEEPCPMNYQTMMSGGKRKLVSNMTYEVEADGLASIDIEKRKVYTDVLSKRKLQEEEVDDELGGEGNLNMENILGKYNKKCNSIERLQKALPTEKIDFLDSNEVLNIDNEDSDQFQKSSAGITIQSKNNLTSGNIKLSGTMTNNSQTMSNNIQNIHNLNSIKTPYKSNRSSEVAQFKSDKSLGAASETSSLNPGKMEMNSSKYNNSNIINNPNEAQENNSQVKDLDCSNKLDHDINTAEKLDQEDISRLNLINKSHLNNISDKLKTQNSDIAGGDKNYNHYDIQQLSYELVKEYSHLRINKDENFMRRMLFDIFKRQTKDERMSKLIDRNKKKIDENERVKTFNRLIEDANRRLEAQEKLENMKNRLDDNILAAPSNKKYKFDEWEEIYEGRFLKYKNEKERKIDDKMQLKIMNQKQIEDEIVENLRNKTKKLPQSVINQSVKRMYEEADRRKFKLEEKRKMNSDEYEFEHERDEISEGEAKDLIKDRDVLPNKYKKFGKAPKYNFQSDLSGAENITDEETSKQIIRKKSNSKDKNFNVKVNNSTPKINVNIKNYNVPAPVDRSHQKGKMQRLNSKNNKPISILTNTEINNKRFDKDKSNISKSNNHNRHHSHNLNNNYSQNKNLVNPNININPYAPVFQNFNNMNNTNKSPSNLTPNSEIKKSIYSNNKNIKYNVEDHINKEILFCQDEEDEEIRSIPRPIENSLNSKHNSNYRINSDKFKLNDYKKIKNNNSNLQNVYFNNSNFGTTTATPAANKNLYMPDFLASKLVEGILQKKLNN